ncbi:hypothetical protein FJZ36_14765, partial [Candidatus Poribacteria bacterium]|nr:hypothetical protein [Candidatus Poribacteria bacterium]
YGWVPETLSPAGKRLDAMVLVRKPTWAGNICEVRPIGALKRRDRDHKIVCVLLSEARFEAVRDLTDLDDATLRRMAQFFEPFFPLQGWLNRVETTALLKEAHEHYRQKARLRQIPDFLDSGDDEDFPDEFDSDDDDEIVDDEGNA